MKSMTETIVRCPACGAANRIPPEKNKIAARCGKCHTLLPSGQQKNVPGEVFKMRCSHCGAKNKVPGERIDAGPKCGKCGSLLKTEELFEPQPVMVTDGNFEEKVLKSPLPVLLFAWASWCRTCVAVTPIIDQFAADAKGKIRVGKINVETSPMLASKFDILSVPFLFIFDNGRMMESMPGALQKHELMMKMAKYL